MRVDVGATAATRRGKPLCAEEGKKKGEVLGPLLFRFGGALGTCLLLGLCELFLEGGLEVVAHLGWVEVKQGAARFEV